MMLGTTNIKKRDTYAEKGRRTLIQLGSSKLFIIHCLKIQGRKCTYVTWQGVRLATVAMEKQQ